MMVGIESHDHENRNGDEHRVIEPKMGTRAIRARRTRIQLVDNPRRLVTFPKKATAFSNQ
jgi:hypothetical protein